MKRVLKGLFCLLLLGGMGYFGWNYLQKRNFKEHEVSYRTVAVERGELVQEVTATGEVQPIKQVEVGTQVNGPILKLFADFNTHVTNNQVIALIDPAVYDAAYVKACAQLKSNEANIENIRVKLAFAEKTLARQSELAKLKMVAQSALDSAVAEEGSLRAQLKIAEATVEQSQAAVKQAKTNLDYCTIRSPVDGVVINRAVDEGQTVVSSMSAQKLFTLAVDLRRIQVQASVPEADVGMVRTNQVVTFTVDAYRRKFKGRVVQIRLASDTQSNVVTYPVMIEAENPDQMLYPGMTANIAIEVGRVRDAVIIPALALRFHPPGLESGIKGTRVWTCRSNEPPSAVGVKTGLSDGIRFALIGGGEKLEGKRLVIGLRRSEREEGTRNPFIPKRPNSMKKGPGPRKLMRM